MIRSTSKSQSRINRHRRIRAAIEGTAQRPRLAVQRSLKHIHAQLIDDLSGKTIIGVSDVSLKISKGTKTERAQAVGEALATKAKVKKITVVVFDRGGNKYHGRIKALAEAARKTGLII